MLPRDLNPESFATYAPGARALAREYVGALRDMPLSFVAGLLREIIDYDYKFPAERKTLERELENLAALHADDRTQWLQGFASISLSRKLERFDWVNSPAQFVEQLSSHLWTTHQLDAFRTAATTYANRFHAAVPPQAPALPRLGIAVVGQGVDSYDAPLFRKLRPHGAYFSRVNPNNGLNILLDVVAERSNKHPGDYLHWYVDGGQPAEHDSAITSISYAQLEPVRNALLQKMHSETAKPGMGPEMLRTLMAQLRPGDLGISVPADPVLSRFQVSLLTEGSGTQIFSTSFTQWAAREALRRAEPVSLLVRFAPRQRQRPMSQLLAPSADHPELDSVGSLVDADIGAYYNWINQQRLSGADQSSFLAWFEGHGVAVLIGPTVPRGTVSDAPTGMKQLLSWIL